MCKVIRKRGLAAKTTTNSKLRILFTTSSFQYYFILLKFFVAPPFSPPPLKSAKIKHFRDCVEKMIKITTRYKRKTPQVTTKPKEI